MEESVNELLTDINANVTSNDIEDWHRTGKKDSRIGSTVNRKHAEQALYNKKNLSKSRKNTHLTLTIIPFLLARI